MGALQDIKGRITAAEVVHPDFETKILEAFNLCCDEIKITAHDTFGDFYGQFIPRNTCIVDPHSYFLDYITSVKIRPGKVDGNWYNIQSLFFLSPDFFNGLFNHVKIQFIYQVCIFKGRNKI